MYNKKKTVIVVMMIAVMLMATGYAWFATTLNISTQGNISSMWSVYFSSISEGTAVGTATNAITPNVSGTSATISVNLASPGDSMTYKLVLTNGGNIDAIIEKINAVATGSPAIIYSISGISNGEKLGEGQSKEITLKVEYDANVTSQPAETGKTLTISIVSVQDVGQDIEGGDVEIDQPQYLYLANKILQDNTAYADNVRSPYVNSDTGINFSNAASTSNGLGLYYTSTNTENNKTTYYFRGAVENNHVKFAKNESGQDLYWRIVRINEDGSVRLIYNGTDSSGTNSIINIATGYSMGYMDSTDFIKTQEELDSIANTSDSDRKKVIDEWFVANMLNYSNFLADAGFCNDRTVASSSPAYDNYISVTFGTALQFACPNKERDLFTLKDANFGNKALIYPIGMITEDEATYSGYGVNSYSSYLDNGYVYWTMTPRNTSVSNGFMYVLGSGNSNNGFDTSNASATGLTYASIFYEEGVRPVINVKGNIQIYLEGTGNPGTSTNPYIIK